jgi:glycosyltransferase involved in cell wall biosynthesis
LYEGFGFPVVEAMSCGAPVVCSNASSLPEVAGDAALLVDPTDVASLAAALARVAADEGLRNDLRERGFRQASRFSWRQCAQQVLEVLEEVGRELD